LTSGIGVLSRFLDPAKPRDTYLATFLAELGKVRVPTGEGDTLNKALEAVSNFADSELTVIPGMRTRLRIGADSRRYIASYLVWLRTGHIS